MESLINWFTVTLDGIVSKEAIVFLISMVPILELRGGLIAAKLLGIPLFITPIFNWLKHTSLFRPMVEKLETKAMGKKDQIEKYQFWGLLLFVGIPLPGTGAWTGSLIASLLNIPFKKAFPATILGILLACLIVDILSYGLLGIFL